MSATQSLNLRELSELDDVLVGDCSYLALDEEPKLNKVTRALVVGHLNIHSIPKKYEDLSELLSTLNEKKLLPDVLLLCETFLNEKNFDKFNFQNYNLLSECRKNKAMGGVSIMIRTSLKYFDRSDLNIFEEGKFESIFIEVPRQNGPNVIFGEVYRVPGTNESDFLRNYQMIVDKVRSESKKLIIGTDQNLDYLKLKKHGNTMKFFEQNLTNNLIPSILIPTRVTHSTATLIDNIYIDTELYSDINSFVVTSDISDHFLCLTIIKNPLIATTVTSYSKRVINDTTLRNMRGALTNIDWSCLEYCNVHEASTILNDEIHKALDFYAPVKTFTYNNNYRKRDPWFTLGLKISSTKCQEMFKKVHKLPHNSIEYMEYKNYRNTYKKLRRTAKFNYLHDLVWKSRKDSKRLWAVLNRITGKIRNKKEIPNEISINGVLSKDKKIISDGFAMYYSEIGANIAKDIENRSKAQDQLKFKVEKQNTTCFFFPTSNIEIERFIKGLKSKNSKGYDEITNNILKAIFPSIINALRIIFNKSMSSGEFPENMKLAIVKPLYKAKEKSEICNYRPISLLPVLSKILEKIVNSRMVNYLNRYGINYEGQYGFRKNRNTTDAILDLTGNILEGFDKGMISIALFLDMTKAFDSIKHETLLKKMECYGIRGCVLQWFRNYLSNRNLKVIFQNVLSNEFPVKCGVPQGSVLGPLLYSLLVNDMPRSLKFSNCVLYADDTTLLISGNNIDFLYKKINDDLSRLEQWFNQNSLLLNVDKSCYMLFKPKNKIIKKIGTIKIRNYHIKKVTHTKFLGIHIDENLDWNIHIKNMLIKIASGLYSLNMTKHLLPFASKKLLYFANIQSRLTYAISVWGPMVRKKDLKKLQVQQNKAVRALFKLNKRTKLENYYKQANILNIESLIEQALLSIPFRYVNSILPTRIANLFEPNHHGYSTRNKDSLITRLHSSNIYNKSFLARSPHLWLQVPLKLKDCNNVKTFLKNYHKYKINI